MRLSSKLKFTTLFLTAFGFLIANSLPASAKLRITERTKFYTVTGKTGKQLFRSIDRKGPKLKKTGHAIATASRKVKFRNLKTGIRGNKCVITKLDLDVHITYTYPKWRGSKRASKELRDTWNKFMARVEKHEETHGRIFREHARKVYKLLLKMEGRASRGCKDFGKFTKRSFKLADTHHFRRHRLLDRRDSYASSRVRRLQALLLRSK